MIQLTVKANEPSLPVEAQQMFTSSQLPMPNEIDSPNHSLSLWRHSPSGRFYPHPKLYFPQAWENQTIISYHWPEALHQDALENQIEQTPVPDDVCTEEVRLEPAPDDACANWGSAAWAIMFCLRFIHVLSRNTFYRQGYKRRLPFSFFLFITFFSLSLVEISRWTIWVF